jgi:hypothetical protein
MKCSAISEILTAHVSGEDDMPFAYCWHFQRLFVLLFGKYLHSTVSKNAGQDASIFV